LQNADYEYLQHKLGLVYEPAEIFSARATAILRIVLKSLCNRLWQGVHRARLEFWTKFQPKIQKLS